MWLQRRLTISAKTRGFHLVTAELEAQLPELRQIKQGLCHLLLQHTSASLSLNENADPSVRSDLEAYINRLVPENAAYFEHIYEGADDMPAHIKASLLGCQLSLPISHGQLALGTWQGIYLGEHRNYAGERHILASLHGE